MHVAAAYFGVVPVWRTVGRSLGDFFCQESHSSVRQYRSLHEYLYESSEFLNSF